MSFFSKGNAEVVDVNVSFLFELDARTQFEILVDFKEDSVVSKFEGCTLFLTKNLAMFILNGLCALCTWRNNCSEPLVTSITHN